MILKVGYIPKCDFCSVLEPFSFFFFWSKKCSPIVSYEQGNN